MQVAETRQWFCFILIWSSIRGWGRERKGLTAVCEVLNKDAAMTAVLTEQWNISVLMSCCASIVSYLWQIMTSKQSPILSGPVSFWFLLPLRWISTGPPGEVWLFYSHIGACDGECVKDVLGLTPGLICPQLREYMHILRHAQTRGEANWWISVNINISQKASLVGC